jgi:hypothetical protein
MPERAPIFFWRFLIITASYTYNVSPGPVPVTVIFTDTSSGSPTKWLWNFGDGQSSEEQHPTHVYAVAGIYTVTLNAYIPSGQINVWPTPVSALHKLASGSTNLAAHAAFLAKAWSSADPYEWSSFFVYKFSATNYEYYSRKITYEVDLTSHVGRILIMGIWFNNLPGTVASGAKMQLGGVLRVLPDFTLLTMADLSSLAGGIHTIEINDFYDLAPLPEPVLHAGSGWEDDEWYIQSYGVSEGDSTSQDINIAVDWCGLGWLLVSKNIVVVSPTERNLVVETDRQVHLTAKYMLEKPNKSVKWRIKYGMPYRCYPHYDLSYKGSVEQLEPSDTLVHTFPINLMLPSPTLNIVLSGVQCGDQVASRSPLIEVDSVFV